MTSRFCASSLSSRSLTLPPKVRSMWLESRSQVLALLQSWRAMPLVLPQNESERHIGHRALHAHHGGPRFRSRRVAQLVQFFVDDPVARPLYKLKVDRLEEFDRALQVGNLVTDKGQPQHVGGAVRRLREQRRQCQGKTQGGRDREREFGIFHDVTGPSYNAPTRNVSPDPLRTDRFGVHRPPHFHRGRSCPPCSPSRGTINGWLYSLSNGCGFIAGAVSGKHRAAAALSGASRRDRRRHRRDSECAAQAERLPAGPLAVVARFRGLLL